ncbi:hypothetical protein HY493_03540 [Candidatus Woesearchaeota archaeon]|nr:hypothetical protein [Candidatus Woesearchaeota archaeon]
MVERSYQKPVVAHKVAIADILAGRLIERPNEPSAIVLGDGRELVRANVIGLVVDRSDGDLPSLVIDDGTERILVRPFERIPGLTDAALGNTVLVIGRPRTYGVDRFLVPECVRVLESPRWLELRRKELVRPTMAAEASRESSGLVEEEVVGQKGLLDHIRGLDKGIGADVEEVLQKTKCTQEDLQRLLVRGEVFEVSPGRIKVLE